MSMRTTDTAMQHNTGGRGAANPLSAAAMSAPCGAAAAISMAARATAALLALWIAVDGMANSEDTYRRTTVFAIEAAIVIGLSFIPAPGRWTSFLTVLGGSVALFTGALLAFDVAGMLMMVAGSIAVVAALVESHRRGDDMSVGVGALFLGSGVTAILIGDVVLQEAASLAERWLM
jgi:hypothetical protein